MAELLLTFCFVETLSLVVRLLQACSGLADLQYKLPGHVSCFCLLYCLRNAGFPDAYLYTLLFTWVLGTELGLSDLLR